jgi:hypothetical protein
MGVLPLSLEDLDEIVQPALGILLQKCGIASTFPRKLIWTAKKYQGLGASHPYFAMLIKKLAVVLVEPQHGSNAATAFIVSVEDLRREAGFPGFLADIPNAILSSTVVTSCWIKHLLLHLQALHVRLEDPLLKLASQREDDIFLSEYFVRSEPTEEVLRDLLHCCQFLGAHTLANLATANGTRIRPLAWSGTLVARRL